MSDFWGLSSGESATDTGTEFEVSSGNFEVIPDGSKVLAMVENAEWKQDDKLNEYLSLQWTALKPEAVANRKIFQKLYLTDLDASHKKPEEKRDKARRMFAAIDANAGGKLATLVSKPDADAIMRALGNRTMVIRLGVWSIKSRETGELIEGNWVQAVAPKTADLEIKPAKPRAEPRVGNSDIGDDSLPF